MLDIEVGLVSRFGWSLYEIDQTDVESLLPFIQHLNQAAAPKEPTVYADQVDL